jgi:hypothetical protein
MFAENVVNYDTSHMLQYMDIVKKCFNAIKP